MQQWHAKLAGVYDHKVGPGSGGSQAHWTLRLSAGGVESSTLLRDWVPSLGQVADLDTLVSAVPEVERTELIEALAARNPGYRSITHHLSAVDGEQRLVQHLISFDVGNNCLSGSLVDITPQRQMTLALASLARMVSSGDEQGFYDGCVESLAEVYGVAFAFIALVEPDGLRATTLAVWGHGAIQPNFTYDLHGSPCEDVMNRCKELIPMDAAALYPEDHLLAEMGIDSYFGSPLVDADGKVFGIVSVMDDRPVELSRWTAPILSVFSARIGVEVVRAREAAAARVREERLAKEASHAQRFEALGHMGGSVAHDFNNLLTVMMGNVALLQEQSTTEESHALISEVARAGEQARALSQRLLDFSRQQLVEPVRVELNQAVREQEPMLRRILGPRSQLVMRLDGRGRAEVVFNAGHVEQILLNLVVNARDAMPEGGDLFVETHLGRDDVRLEVRDSGNGIPDEIADRIFDPYFTTKADRGTGLGLATVYNAVRMAGGTITVQRQPQAGAHFIMRFPRVS